MSHRAPDCTRIEGRQDFRSLRVARIEQLDLVGERFRDEPGKTLPDLMRAVAANDSA